MQGNRSNLSAILLALLAVVIWSGNFVVARGVTEKISPVALSFYRWLTAAIVLTPFIWKSFLKEKAVVRENMLHLLLVAIFGVAMFNTFVYYGGRYTSALNLSIINSTSAPVMVLLMAALFLREKITAGKFWGMILCLIGVLTLISEGQLSWFKTFQFGTGERWVLLGAFCFAVYNILVRQKKYKLDGLLFLWVIFVLGVLCLLPFYITERAKGVYTRWDADLIAIILYIGVGASVISYACWNISIAHLGAGRTALFGNLLPVFSAIEAIAILDEQFTWLHVGSMLIVFCGIMLANYSILFPRKDRVANV